MTSRNINITNNYGKPVRVQVIQMDNNTDDITLENNKTRTLAIRTPLFREPSDCDVTVLVYEIGDDTFKEKQTIQGSQNDVDVTIEKDNNNPVISLV